MINDDFLDCKYCIDKFRLSEDINVGDKIIPKGTTVKILHKFEDKVLAEVLDFDIQALISTDKLLIIDKPTFNYDLTPYTVKKVVIKEDIKDLSVKFSKLLDSMYKALNVKK